MFRGEKYYSQKHLLPNLLLVLIFYSCAAKIGSFTATPATITKGDSILLNWKIKGKPVLMFDQRKIAHPKGDSIDILEFTLSVQKGDKVKYIKRQVPVLPEESSDRVVLLTNELHGDTLIAEGVKDTSLWSNFEIVSVSSISKKILFVIHDNRQGILESAGTSSDVWEGSKYSGFWRIMTILTEAEKKDSSIITGDLEIKALIRPIKK